MEGREYAPNKIIAMYDVLRYVVYGILEVEPIPVTEHRSFAAIVEPNFVDAISERKVLRIFGQVIQPLPTKRKDHKRQSDSGETIRTKRRYGKAACTFTPRHATLSMTI